MSLPYRGHGPDVLYQIFNISCVAGNALLGLVGCPTEEDCAMYRYSPGPTGGRSTAHRLTKEIDTESQRRSLEQIRGALPSTRSNIDVHTDKYVACPDTKLNARTGERILPRSPKTNLMSLPVEIRAMILRHLLGDRKIHMHYDCDYIDDPRWPKMFTDRLSVLLVSKILHGEALETFYSTNTFSFDDHESFNIFIRRIAPKRAGFLRNIELSTTSTFYAGIASRYGVCVPLTEPSNWILHTPDRDNKAVLRKLGKLAGVTDVTIRLHEQWDVEREVPKKWKLAWDERRSRLRDRLFMAFFGIHLLRNLKRVKVRIACAKVLWDQELWSQVEADHELYRGALRVVEDDFARELMSWRNN